MFQARGPVGRVGRKNVIWEALAWPGYEHLCLEERTGGFTVDGLIVAVLGEQPSRVWYQIELEDDWSFRSLRLACSQEIDESRDGPIDLYGSSLDLTRTAEGVWDHDWYDGDPDLSGCTDIDIAVTPFTNTLPIRRLQLEEGDAEEIDVVYVTVPDLTLSAARQRYNRLDASTYRFETLESSFTADIMVDEQGIVTDYPGLFRRVWTGRDDQ